MSDNEQAKLYIERLKKDPELAMSKLVRIISRDRKDIPLNLYPGQQKYMRNRKQVTYVIKPRRVGLTVCKMAEGILNARFNANFHSLILNKDANDNTPLFNTAKSIDRKLPLLFQGEKDRDTGTMIWYTDTQSSLSIQTVGTTAAQASKKGRGVELSDIHGTEVGYWAPGALEEILHGAGNTRTLDARMTFESTSSGPRGEFSQTCLGLYSRGQEGDEDGVWCDGDRCLIFLSWLDHPEYKLQLLQGEEYDPIDEEEERLCGMGATPEQIKWRRAKLNQAKANTNEASKYTPEQRFKQEFPASFMDSMEESGGLFFESRTMVAVRDWVASTQPEPIECGLITAPNADVSVIPKTPKNNYTIWAPPAKGWINRYIVFVDPATGGTKSDYDVGYVLDLRLGLVCAKFSGRLGWDVSAPMAMRLAKYYNGAYLGWDRTGIGNGFSAHVMANDYPNVWHYGRTGEEKKNILTMGVHWTEALKNLSLEWLRSSMYERTFMLLDSQFYKESEMFGFQDQTDRCPEAPSGSHDDHIMCAAGLVLMKNNLKLQPQQVENVNPHTNNAIFNMRKIVQQSRRAERKKPDMWSMYA